MADFLLGLDYGTGGAKACIIDSQADVLGFSYEEYLIIHEKPGFSEHDANLYWQITCRLIQEVIAKAGISPAEVKAISASSALPSLVMVDRHHNPIHRAYNLLDKRAVKEVEWLKEHIGQDILYRISGYRIEDHPVLVNLMWEKKNRPDAFRQIYKVLTIDGFIALKLTGIPSLNYSSAAFYGVAYNLRKQYFEKEILDKIGISPAILPDIFHCHDVIGTVTKQAAQQTRLVEGIPVAAGQVDCNASWLGAGAIDVGDFQSNLGTVGNFGIIHKNTDFIFSDIGQLMINFPYTVDSKNTYVTVPTTATGGQCLRYIRDNFSGLELHEEQTTGLSAYDQLTRQAQDVPLGSDGLIVLPYFMGERSPIWDAHARACIFGLSLHHTKGHLVRAMMEGVAFAMYDSFRLLKQSGLDIKFPMVLNEGGAVSSLWRQIIADVFNVPIVLAKNRAGASYGDAILAGVCGGVFKDFLIAKEKAVYIDPVEPDEKKHAVYMEYFDLYKCLYEHVKNDYKVLSKLREKN